MIAYKGFDKGLSCRGYQFSRGWNEMEKANCGQNGFHAATNPLDCLTYYRNADKSEYWIVECAGDMDEDACDTKVTCTRMRPVMEIGVAGLIAAGLLYALKHKNSKMSSAVSHSNATAINGWAVSAGENPCCKGKKTGDVLGFLKTADGVPENAFYVVVDGKRIKPDVQYTFDNLIGGAKNG